MPPRRGTTPGGVRTKSSAWSRRPAIELIESSSLLRELMASALDPVSRAAANAWLFEPRRMKDICGSSLLALTYPADPGEAVLSGSESPESCSTRFEDEEDAPATGNNDSSCLGTSLDDEEGAQAGPRSVAWTPGSVARRAIALVPKRCGSTPGIGRSLQGGMMSRAHATERTKESV